MTPAILPVLTSARRKIVHFNAHSLSHPTAVHRPQAFDVILDTGSADLWVTSINCQTCTSSIPLFNPSQSTTYKSSTAGGPVEIQYGSGQVSGLLSADTVNMAGFTVNQQIFREYLLSPLKRSEDTEKIYMSVAVDQTSDGLLDAPVSGIMGLGFQTIASTNAVPWWQALLNANDFSSPMFAFWITRFGDVPNASAEEPGGVLTLGGTNSSLFQGSIDYVDMPSGATPSFWLLSLTRALHCKRILQLDVIVNFQSSMSSVNLLQLAPVKMPSPLLTLGRRSSVALLPMSSSSGKRSQAPKH